ncbi:hypothetical protein DHEL01_v209073 [Diaporthe helianthi]|uniref:Uncharacterized protein n=1 Tax=Diaporthe helianthi TaxID=158607 RepID=A0A2P5HQL5_DIAHE|nr:hypothetical protein DHEL01_v209073 [Diaporthe helianthi]
MWYHRRKRPQSAKEEGFNPATDSVRATINGPGFPGAQVKSIYDPVAWRENYSAACPQELDGRPSLHFPKHEASDAELRGGGCLERAWLRMEVRLLRTIAGHHWQTAGEQLASS